VNIPVITETDGLTGTAPAVLREIAEMLAHLLQTKETGLIDLRNLPLSPADRDWLREHLGKGEVTMTLATGGRSQIRETAFPGVWWIEHHNEQDVLYSEFIEVAYVPELALAHPDDVIRGQESLNSKLTEISRSFH
jgi:hydrogenase-1 operon protein HyaF